MGACRWIRVNNFLALQWKDSKVVNVLPIIEKRNQITHCNRQMKGCDGQYHTLRLQQPRAVADCNKYMKGIDQSDQLLSYCNALRKADKYWKTLSFHTLDIAVVNAFVVFLDMVLFIDPLFLGYSYNSPKMV